MFLSLQYLLSFMWIPCLFVSHAGLDTQVTDLGSVLHMVGGTAAAFMIFFLPGMLLINAAIVKRTAEVAFSLISHHACLQVLWHMQAWQRTSAAAHCMQSLTAEHAAS